jgi:hypothetical protein
VGDSAVDGLGTAGPCGAFAEDSGGAQAGKGIRMMRCSLLRRQRAAGRSRTVHLGEQLPALAVDGDSGSEAGRVGPLDQRRSMLRSSPGRSEPLLSQGCR